MSSPDPAAEASSAPVEVSEPMPAPAAPVAPPPAQGAGGAPVDSEEAEVAELKEMMKRPPNSPPRRKKAQTSRKPKPEWNSTPLRKEPPALRGLKTDREPWARDQMVYQQGMEGHGAVASLRKAPQRRMPSQATMEREYHDEYNKWMRRTGWNSTPFRNAPDPLRGLKPVTREPWFEDMAVYNAKFSNHEVDEKGEYEDGTLGAGGSLYRDKSLSDGYKDAAEANWDSSTWKYVPHALKGIKPVTNEPWARDEAVYNESRNSVDTRGAVEFIPTAHFSFTDGGEDDGSGTWDASIKPPEGAMQAYPK